MKTMMLQAKELEQFDVVCKRGCTRQKWRSGMNRAQKHDCHQTCTIVLSGGSLKTLCSDLLRVLHSGSLFVCLVVLSLIRIENEKKIEQKERRSTNHNRDEIIEVVLGRLRGVERIDERVEVELLTKVDMHLVLRSRSSNYRKALQVNDQHRRCAPDADRL
jgi:hypothetical protein